MLADIMDGHSTYSYQSLDIGKRLIRVVKLQPIVTDNPEAEICLTVHLVDVDESPTPVYSALSYVWGDNAQTFPITIDGKSMSIGENLHDALQHIRRNFCQREPLDIWIDAISINQADKIEQSRMVQMMGNIYEQAQRVILWVGPEADNSSVALDMIRAFSSGSVDVKDISSWRESMPELYTLEAWNALNALFLRSFWRRLWILQEIVLARASIMLCGDKTLEWSELETGFLKWDEELRQRSTRVWNAFDGEIRWKITNNNWMILRDVLFVRKARETSEEAPIVLEMLDRLFELDATDPRDKIFGLLGITTHDIAVNYTQSPAEVYTSFAKGEVQHGRTGILLLAGSGLLETDGKTCDLPSWVPDWKGRTKARVHSDYMPLAPLFRAGYLEPELAHASKRFITVASDLDHALQAEAIVCQQVTKISTLSFDSNPDFWDQFPRSNLDEKYATGIPIYQALLRTLLFDCERFEGTRLNTANTLYYDLVTGCLAYMARTLGLRDGDFDILDHRAIARSIFGVLEDVHDANVDTRLTQIFGLSTDPLVEKPWPADRGAADEGPLIIDFTERTMFHCLRKRFFWTQDGYFGIGPSGCEVGDVACALLGSRSLHMLRQREGNRYELVGPCFVLGFMDGEALEALVDTPGAPPSRSITSVLIL